MTNAPKEAGAIGAQGLTSDWLGLNAGDEAEASELLASGTISAVHPNPRGWRQIPQTQGRDEQHITLLKTDRTGLRVGERGWGEPLKCSLSLLLHNSMDFPRLCED